MNKLQKPKKKTLDYLRDNIKSISLTYFFISRKMKRFFAYIPSDDTRIDF